jgi:hypothetical protein
LVRCMDNNGTFLWKPTLSFNLMQNRECTHEAGGR